MVNSSQPFVPANVTAVPALPRFDRRRACIYHEAMAEEGGEQNVS
jgi:hypothetical protein